MAFLDADAFVTDTELAKKIVEHTKFKELFPNVPLTVYRVNDIMNPSKSPAMWHFVVELNGVAMFAVFRTFNDKTYELQTTFEYTNDIINFIEPVIERWDGSADPLEAFNEFFVRINNDFDAYVEKINGAINDHGYNWIYEKLLKKIWDFRLGLVGGGGYFSDQ